MTWPLKTKKSSNAALQSVKAFLHRRLRIGDLAITQLSLKSRLSAKSL